MDVELLRARTPGCAHRVHLNNAGAALLAQPTLDAMTDQLRLEAELGGYEAEAAARGRIGDTYAALAELLGGRPEQIALFDNSTHAWNAGCYSIPLRKGDRIITGTDEYGSSVLAYLQIAARTGAELVVIPNDASGQLDLDVLRAEVDERTKLIGLTWVPTASGLVNPAAEVGAIARTVDALYLLDATQAVGQFPIDVAAIGCDLLNGTGRKFLRGPRGTGFLWVSDRALARLDPFVVEIQSATWDGARGFTFAPGARRFETWENSYVNIVGLGCAVRQALDLGLAAIGERTGELGALLRAQLAEIPGVTTYDLGARRCAIVTAGVAGHAPAEVAGRLAEAGINVSTTVPEHTPFDSEDRGVHPLVRLSPHYYNTEAEIAAAVRVMAEIAAG
ncbi:MAG TPA: aminotransferase class V-fold PLP-dependent enzyme [Pseudonocardiaceae bacterium]|jgi:selenocysteine lyase/cysteine desulfurase|nr:aminotransferase class V-fold PLP-dependent enzyme [Pseudonocardiaceae bacterium]